MTRSRSKCSLLEVYQLKNDFSNKILQGAFDIKDLQIQTSLNFGSLFNSKNISVNAPTYTDYAVSILDQITQDIYISINLFEFGDWDLSILHDALKLLRYTFDNLFGGSDNENVQAKGLGFAYRECAQSKLKTCSVAAKAFRTARKEAISAFGALLEHLKAGGHHELLEDLIKISPEDKISTATFFELLVRNEAKKTFGVSRFNGLENELYFKIVGIVSRLNVSHHEISKRWCNPRAECRWRPKTIAIIQDKATGLVFTGASKAIAAGLPPLEKLAYDITVKRLGNEFQEKIDNCNARFESCLSYYDTEHEIAPPWFKKLQWFSVVIRQDLSKIPIFQTSTDSDSDPSSKVVCLALDTSYPRVKSPCTRCQCFYHTWYLFQGQRPNMTEKWSLFKSESPWGQFKMREKRFNYCAETVAAAQLVSLHTGNVISDIQE